MILMFNSKKQEEEYYAAKTKKISEVLRNSGFKLKAISQAGSRAKKTNKWGSDQDIIFNIEGNPNSMEIYSQAKNILKNNFPSAKITDGAHKKVIHISFTSQDKFDLKHLPHEKYQNQHQKDKDYRK